MAKQIKTEQDVRDLIKKLQGAGVFDTDTSRRIEERSGGTFQSDGQDIMYRNPDQESLSTGDSRSDSIRERDMRNIGGDVPTLSLQESRGFAKDYGLAGIADDQFSGLTRAQATKKAQQIKEGKLQDVTPGSSAVYNPEVISGAKKKFNDFIFALDDINNDPFKKAERKDLREAKINSFTKELGGLFNSTEEFQAALQNPDFQNTLQQLEQQGISATDIEANIRAPQYGQNIGEQTIDSYLGAIDTQQEQLAMQALMPEKQIAQDEINFEQGIAEQYREYYWGTEDQVGLVERQRQEAEESIKLLERREKQEKDNAKAQARLASERYDFELQKTKAEVEKNRLAAKNYMTNHLAKLGALKTTGKAGEALVKLDMDYQKQAQELDTEYSFAKKELDNKLNETLSNIDLETDEAILEIKSDLSKSEEDIWKEIVNIQQNADRKTFEIADNFARDFRSQTDEYRKELEKKAKDYSKNFANTIGANDVSEGSFFKYGKIEGIVNPLGEVIPLDLTPTEQKQVQGAEIRGGDAIRTFISYPSSFKNWYIQGIQDGSLDSGVSLPALQNVYEEWKTQTKKVSENKDSTKITDNAGNVITVGGDDDEIDVDAWLAEEDDDK